MYNKFPASYSRLMSVLPYVFVFDFRGDEGGSTIQFVMAGVSVLLTLYILSRYRFFLPDGFSKFLFYGLGALLVGFSSAIFFNVPVNQLIRVSLPFVLFVLSSWIGANVATDFINLRRFMGTCITAGIVNSFFRYYWGLHYNSLGFDDVRYQILTPIMPFLISYCVVGVLFSRTIPIIPLLLSSWIVILSLLSVTRSLILTAVFGLFISFIYLFRIGARNPALVPYAKWRLPSVAFFALMCVVGGSITAVMRPEVFNDWHERLFESKSTVDDIDITYMTRVAEAQGIWDQGISSPVSFIFGRGFGSNYSWSSDYVEHMRRLSSDLANNMDQYWSGTHTIFTHGFLFGGVLGFLWVVYIYAFPLIRGYIAAIKLKNVFDPEYVRVYLIFNVSIFLFLSQSITSNPLGGERISAQFLGLFCGIVVTLSRNLAFKI